MRIVYQLIQNYLSQKVPSILITVQQSSGSFKYIINVPPTYQRFISNHKMKFQKGARYLFTKTSTETIAGLTGMMLTMFQSGCAYDSKLYVDDKMFQYLEAIRYKMGFKLMPYAYASWSGKYRLGIKQKQRIFKIFQDKTQYYQTFTNLQSYIQTTLTPQQINNPLDFIQKQTLHYKDDFIKFIPFTISTNNELITNFICVPNKLAGKVNAKKLKELGVENRRIGELMKNGRITMDNGKELTIDEVKEPDQASPNLLILHFNCFQSLKAILNHPVLNQYLANKQNMTQSVLYIIQDAQIVRSQDFKIFVSLFDKKTQHMIYNRLFKNKLDNLQDFTSLSPHMDVVSDLSLLFPKVLPNLNQLQRQFLKQQASSMTDIQSLFPETKIHCSKRCYEMILAPTKNVGYIPVKKEMGEKRQLEDISQEVMNQIKGDQLNIIQKEGLPDCANFTQIDPNVVFLGTGSMKPSKHRNVSSIFVQYTKNNSIMLDCGQGSYYQLFNHYGPNKINKIVLDLRIIFITHIHSDHNLGILDLISQRNKLLKQQECKQKLFLVIPFNVLPWFHSYVEKVQNLLEGCEVIFLQWIKNQPLQLSEGTMSKDERKLSCLSQEKSEMVHQNDQEHQAQQNEEQQEAKMAQYLSVLQTELTQMYSKIQQPCMKRFNTYLKQIGITQFLPVPVIHCPQSHGIVITHKSNVKISYSGDTIPVNSFAKASLNSTILIHQATFGDDLIQNAKGNMHSTVGQAIDIGMKANSWKTALTHFSQRYKSAKDIVEPALYKSNQQKYNYALNHTIVCFDHMQMKLSQTPKLPKISRAIAALIPNEKTQE